MNLMICICAKSEAAYKATSDSVDMLFEIGLGRALGAPQQTQKCKTCCMLQARKAT